LSSSRRQPASPAFHSKAYKQYLQLRTFMDERAPPGGDKTLMTAFDSMLNWAWDNAPAHAEDRSAADWGKGYRRAIGYLAEHHPELLKQFQQFLSERSGNASQR
jgi:hypothetical protein